MLWPLWPAGNVQTITWTCPSYPGSGQLYLDLWRNGSYVRYITRLLSQTGNNSFTMCMPADVTPGTNYLLRLTWTDDPSVSFWSEPFTIVGPPVCNVTWPTVGSVVASLHQYHAPGRDLRPRRDPVVVHARPHLEPSRVATVPHPMV